jgi:hypothetical protein
MVADHQGGGDQADELRIRPERMRMRFVVISAAFGAALNWAAPGFAQPVYPWCLKADVGAGAMVDYCQFASFEQCAQERFRWGTTSFCILNPQHYFRQGPEEGRRVPSRRGGAR